MTDQIPQLKESTTFNFLTSIWIVPVMALLIAMWLGYEHYSGLGSEIKIYFEKNEGLRINQSQLRYKNIPIGKVVDIQLQKNGKGVIVIVRMNKGVSSLVNEKSKFWIVKTEIGVLGISGLDTLFSGNYIDMYKGVGDKESKEFHGLNHAYRGNGNHYELTANSGYGLETGAPIFYKSLKVGQIEKTALSADGLAVHYNLFIEKKYVPYVHAHSKFWVMSKASIALLNGKLNFDLAPLSALISGGIVLSSTGGSVATDGSTFRLFANEQAAKLYKLGQGVAFVKTFEINTMTSTVNLAVGASVNYRGYQVGKVRSITPYFDGSVQMLKTRLLLDIDLSSFANPSEPEMGKYRFYQAVNRGLSTKISSRSPIIDDMFVDLVFNKGAKKQHVLEQLPYAVLPNTGINSSLSTEFQKIIASMAELLNDNKKPIKEILANLNEISKNVHAMSASKSFKVLPDDLKKTMAELTQTLHTVNQLAEGDSRSALSAQISQTLKVIGETSKDMQQFLNVLNNKPNALIFGD